MDCPIRPEQEYIDYHNEEAFMYDYAPRCPSPIQTYPTYPPYSVPYQYYPSWCGENSNTRALRRQDMGHGKMGGICAAYEVIG
ncbi:hypothetical protein sscle_05g048400 [Sclerotinia sclerotiorum 1980 UF-70]|uniref:Uncharacterized protein n=1 Tax=Sclerotinia sclerotiorum (strain ATCC 18683 / 1980 / Ss-1) TaxID=665079 RepID=A0A1D9Q541_SCLS1|nr:hypothetical protein sscle_05g048400 [Sclerotinia sclerotiorum 1980 UF-70]